MNSNRLSPLRPGSYGACVPYNSPDTDGVASALALSELFSYLDVMPWRPSLSGILNPETRLALKLSHSRNPRTKSAFDAHEIALVDTHSMQQLPHDLRGDRVRLIVDHHRDGDLADFPNADIRIERVGATATLIYEMAKATNYRFTQPTAVMLTAAIVSNTLDFAAPSTSSRDRLAFAELSSEYSLPPAFVSSLLGSRSALLDGELEVVLQRDVKVAQSQLGLVAIAQIEAPDAGSLASRDGFVDAVDRLRRTRQVDHVVVNLVDVSAGSSILVASSDDVRLLLSEGLDIEFHDSVARPERVLLRKTDLIPALTGATWRM